MDKQKAHDILGAARERDVLVALYGSPRSSRCTIGFVLAFSDVHVLLEAVSSNGRNDGWFLRELESIGRIDIGGRYEETLLSLYRARGEAHLKEFLPPIDLSSELQLELLLAARAHDFAVRIYNGNRDPINGFVREVETNTVTVDQFDEHGAADGETVVNTDELDAIRVHDDDLQDLKLLARWHDSPPLS